jgi:hypothetical protein
MQKALLGFVIAALLLGSTYQVASAQASSLKATRLSGGDYEYFDFTNTSAVPVALTSLTLIGCSNVGITSGGQKRNSCGEFLEQPMIVSPHGTFRVTVPPFDNSHKVTVGTFMFRSRPATSKDTAVGAGGVQ